MNLTINSINNAFTTCRHKYAWTSYVFPAVQSLLTAVLIILSFPNHNYSFLIWISLIPILFVVWSHGLKAAFLWGMVSGCIAYLFLFSWINTAVSVQAISRWEGIFSLSFISLYVAFYTTGSWSFVLALIRTKVYMPVLPFFAASFWTAMEYLRAHLLTGFPWGLLGYSQWNSSFVSQIAEYTGVFGVSFVIVFFNISLFLFIKSRRFLYLSYACGAILFTMLAGAGLINRDNGPRPYTIRVAAIQGNIDQDKKWDPNYRGEIMKQMSEIVIDASRSKPDLIVWPETSVPGYLPYDGELSVWVTGLAAKTATNHLVGAPYYNKELDENSYNSSFLINSKGTIMGWHKKIHLVPFGEFSPFRFLFRLNVLNSLGEFKKGLKPTVLQLNLDSPEGQKAVHIGPILCSESFYGGLVRGFMLGGADILVNQNNNAWFLETSAPYQNLSMGVFRAIENRREILASGNTGITGLIEPSGTVSKVMPQFIAGSLLCTLTPYTRITFYAAHGDVLAKLCIVISFLFFGIYFYKVIKKSIKNTA